MTTIIAYERTMICDSFSADGYINHNMPQGVRKIVRCPDGSLFGSAGKSSNTSQLRAWAKAGMDFDNPPKLRREADDCDSYSWLRMAPDGRVFAGCLDMIEEQVPSPYFIGSFAAGYMLLGAADICKLTRPRLIEVMHSIDRRDLSIAQPFYFFDLDHPELDP